MILLILIITVVLIAIILFIFLGVTKTNDAWNSYLEYLKSIPFEEAMLKLDKDITGSVEDGYFESMIELTREQVKNSTYVNIYVEEKYFKVVPSQPILIYRGDSNLIWDNYDNLDYDQKFRIVDKMQEYDIGAKIIPFKKGAN